MRRVQQPRGAYLQRGRHGRPGRAGSRADIEARLPPPNGPALLDVSVTHRRAAIYVTDGPAIQGSAAAKRDALKCRGHNGHHHPGCTFTRASVEAYEYLGQPLVRYLNTLSEVAAARGPAVTIDRGAKQT